MDNAVKYCDNGGEIGMMLDVRVNDVVTVRIIRGGEEMSVSITVTEESIVAY